MSGGDARGGNVSIGVGYSLVVRSRVIVAVAFGGSSASTAAAVVTAAAVAASTSSGRICEAERTAVSRRQGGGEDCGDFDA